MDDYRRPVTLNAVQCTPCPSGILAPAVSGILPAIAGRPNWRIAFRRQALRARLRLDQVLGSEELLHNGCRI